jgi:hypothetical protein
MVFLYLLQESIKVSVMFSSRAPPIVLTAIEFLGLRYAVYFAYHIYDLTHGR